MKELLSNNRPAYVQKLIDEQYRRVSTYPLRQGYRYFGNERAYRWGLAGTDSRELLKANGRSVLDVGAGEGRVVQSYVRRGYGNQGVALTAHDYSNGQNPTIHLGDANNLLDQLPDPTMTFDVVMSQMTLRHLSDPVACFEQMLNATAEDGVVVTDIPIGRSALIAGCINWLVEKEYFTVEGDNATSIVNEARKHECRHYNPALREVLLRRKLDQDIPVRLPVSYAPLLIGDLVARYTLDEVA